MAFRNLHSFRSLYRTSRIPQSSFLLGSSVKNSNGIPLEMAELNCRKMSSALFNGQIALPGSPVGAGITRSAMGVELEIFKNDIRLATTNANTTHGQAMGSFRVSMLSPGIVYEPYAPPEKMPFWKRCFTRSGWKKTKDDILVELKSAYAIARIRKNGYSKQVFYNEAVTMYKEINTLIANGDKKELRKIVTERMFSGLKNEIKQRETIWKKVYWEMVEPVVKIRTLRARLIGIDRTDTEKLFIQLTIEFLTKQRFEAYDSAGKVVSGDKSKEVLVKDIWVFEKSLYHPGAMWRLCGRIVA